MKCRSRAALHCCVLEECVKGNYFARFHTHSYHCCREMHFITRLDVKFSRLNVKFWQSQWSVKCRSRAALHCCVLEECVKGNYFARFHTHSYHCCREMHFISRLDVKFSKLNVKFWQSQWSVKCRSRVVGYGACLMRH